MEVIVPFVNPSRIFHAVCAYWLMSSAGFSATADGHHASRQAKTMPSARPNRARRWAFSMDENVTLIYLSGGATCIPLLRCREATPLRVTERPLWVLTPWQAKSTLTASAFPWGEIMRVPALAACLLLVFSSSVLRAQSTSASLT